MDRMQGAAVAIVLFALVALAVIPLMERAAGSDIEGSNDGSIYSMAPRSIYDTAVLKMQDGALAIDGEPVTSLGIEGTAMVMSDVLTMAIDMENGSYSAWTILLPEQGCKADSESDPTLVYTFSRGHLTITDSSDSTKSWSSWFRYLLLPSTEGPLGVWPISSLPDLTMSSGSAFYVSEASEDHAGTVYGTPGNLAPGQCIIDGARAFGSASAVSESVLNGTAVKVTSLDADGGIVGDGAYVAFEKTYTYNTQTGQMTGLLMSAGVLLALLLVVSAIARVIR